MAILAGDIKLVASQVMDDVSEGGGAPTPTIIADGTSNSIFNDISELDRAGGRVNLRKVFAHVQTPTTDQYFGANVILADPPDDPLVDIAMFKTGSAFDVRDDARDRIEAYLNRGSKWDGYLWENHITGQRSITIFQRPSAKLPTIGKTLCLVGNEGLGTEFYQYVRVTRVESELRTFTQLIGSTLYDYQATIVTCEISDTLRYDFNGSTANRYYEPTAGKTVLRDTVVADAAKYYGASPTTAPVAIGDVTTQVDSIYTAIVPSAQTETALVDLSAGGTADSLIDSSNGTISYTTSVSFTAGSTYYTGNVITPGTLTISVSGGSLTDDGGDLMSGSTVVGTVNYARGEFAIATGVSAFTGSKTITFTPGAAPTQVADTAAIRVEIENRAYIYNLTIVPPPAPGTLVVSYMAQGNWYDLRDDGAGRLSGSDPAFGAGTVSYTTGTASVTLGALPDVGSEIMFYWGGKLNYLNRAAVAVAAPKVVLQLTKTGITPNSLTVTWNDGTARTAEDDGAGVISGDATGKVNYQSGVVELSPTTLPAGGQSFSCAYTWGAPEVETFTNPVRNPDYSVTLTLGMTNITPGTVEITWPLQLQIVGTDAWRYMGNAVLLSKTVRDDGTGNLVTPENVVFGTINYTTGVVTLGPDTVVPVPMVVNQVVSTGVTLNHLAGGA